MIYRLGALILYSAILLGGAYGIAWPALEAARHGRQATAVVVRHEEVGQGWSEEGGHSSIRHTLRYDGHVSYVDLRRTLPVGHSMPVIYSPNRPDFVFMAKDRREFLLKSERIYWALAIAGMWVVVMVAGIAAVIYRWRQRRMERRGGGKIAAGKREKVGSSNPADGIK